MAWKQQKFAKQRAAADSADWETGAKMKMKQQYMEQKDRKEKEKDIQAQQSSTSTSSTNSNNNNINNITTVTSNTTVTSTTDLTSTTTTTTTTTATTAPTAAPTSSSTPSNRRALHVGNTHTNIPEDQAQESLVNPGTKNTHEWTLYVRGVDVSGIQKVEFTIHSSFTPNIIEVHNSPFEITRRGWGFFNCKIVIFYKSNAAPTTIIHELNFEGNGNFREIVVDV